MVRGDIDQGHTTQIRDESYPMQTPSLEGAGNQVVPEELIRDLLTQYWVTTEAAPKPIIYAKDDVIQANLHKQPIVQVETSDWREEPTGHRHEFVKIDVPLDITCKSTKSRQEMYNLMAEVRRIIYEWMLALQPFHCLYFDGMRPTYPGPGNFEGIVRIRLTADAIPIFLRRNTGEESPNTDPSFFPDGNNP